MSRADNLLSAALNSAVSLAGGPGSEGAQGVYEAAARLIGYALTYSAGTKHLTDHPEWVDSLKAAFDEGTAKANADLEAIQ